MFVTYADGNMTKRQDIRKADRTGNQIEDIPEDFLCPLCGVGRTNFPNSNDSQQGAESFGLLTPCFLKRMGISEHIGV